MNSRGMTRKELARNRRTARFRLVSTTVIAAVLLMLYLYTGSIGAAIIAGILGVVWLIDLATIVYATVRLKRSDH